MTGRQSVSAASAAVLIVLAAAATAVAQPSTIDPGPHAVARRPERWDDRRAHRQRLVRLGRHDRHHERRDGAQPTSVDVVHSPTRLTFVTPPRPAATATALRDHGHLGVDRPDRRLHLRGPDPQRRVRAPASRSSATTAATWPSSRASRWRPTTPTAWSTSTCATKSSGAVRRVSVASSGAQGLGGESTSPAISATGRFIAFQSRATNLVPGDTNGLTDVFLHDRDADGDGIFDESGQRLDRAGQHRRRLQRRVRPGAGRRRRQRRPGDQRQRPLRRLPVGGHEPGRRRHQRPHRHLRVRPAASDHAADEPQRQQRCRRRPQPQPGHEPERPLRGLRVAGQRHRRRRPRHRGQPDLRTSSCTTATPTRTASWTRPVRSTPGWSAATRAGTTADQPQHRSVDHLRRPLRRVRDGGRQRQGRRNCVRIDDCNAARHLHLRSPG